MSFGAPLLYSKQAKGQTMTHAAQPAQLSGRTTFSKVSSKLSFGKAISSTKVPRYFLAT
jgi:hypothetical protein